MALVQTAYIGVSYAIVLASRTPPSPAIRWLLGVGTPLVAGHADLAHARPRCARMRAESDARGRELRESEARTRLVLDSAPDAFVTLDSDGIIRGWNRAAELMFGWSADEAIGEPMRTLITPPEFRDRHEQRRRAMIEGDPSTATSHYEVELQRRDGSRFPAESTVSKVDVRGEMLVAGFIRDVTRSAPPAGGARAAACASRPPARRPSAWPSWSAACSCSWTRRSRTARWATSCPTS